jgi:hypothetical protein
MEFNDHWTRRAIGPGTVIVHGSGAGFAQEIAAGRHQLTATKPNLGRRDGLRGQSLGPPPRRNSDPARR